MLHFLRQPDGTLRCRSTDVPRRSQRSHSGEKLKTEMEANMRHLKLLALATCMTSLSTAGCGGVSGPNAGLPAARSTNDFFSKPSAGSITEYTISAPHEHEPRVKALPIGITKGPDGAIWFAETRLGQARPHPDGRHDHEPIQA